MKKISISILASVMACCAAMAANPIFIETESFAQKGGWSVDQQFMDLMGSPYLIAHGLGKPVADASTVFEIDEAGTYHVYARTFNWVSPWTEKEGPGAFRIKVNGKAMKTVLGTTGNQWMWQYAGAVKLKAGSNSIALNDLKGFDGRCDAIWITPDAGVVPPVETKALEAFRRESGALPQKAADGGKFDLVVVGGGIGGMCAAVSAARLGLKVALINDRPKLGGNNSSEIRVHLGGRIEMNPYPALGRMVREFGHSTKGNANPAECYEDEKKDEFIANEPDVKLFAPYRAVAVNVSSPGIIGSVIIRSIYTGEELELSAPVFSDCTGDGTIGFLAGADWMMGREGRDEFGEELAPEKGDKLTMGASVQWYSVKGEKKSSFPEFNYGVDFSEESCEKVNMGEWTWETGMNYDQIYDFERIRDYGMLVIYSNWSFLKNHFSGKDDYSDLELGWVAYLAGKRESRRLIGDYILKQDDVDKQVFHEDASFTTSWHFDLHFPDPSNSKYFPGEEFKAQTKHNPIYPYAVPYRCLYSRNVNNLFMAGRNISVTHVTLGSTRLMRTIGCMGEVVGMAASICNKYDVLPRDVYQHHLPELKSLMEKGIGKPAETLPDNQHFNMGGHLKSPKIVVSCTSASKAVPIKKIIFPGDYPDPSIVRDGKDFYMTHSSFTYNDGLLIWHSTDLQNWEPIARAVTGHDYSIYAPEITKVGNRFHIYYPTSTGENYVITADSPKGPWSAPVKIEASGVDPGLVRAKDGSLYLYTNNGNATRLSDDGLAAAGEQMHIYDPWEFPSDWETAGVWLESPKLFERNGWYYLLSAEGGTDGPATSHMVVVARSRSALGPWENMPSNPLVHTWSADEEWWSKGHGTIFDDADGNWYIVYHSYRNSYHTLGRSTIIESIEWTKDGWPKLAIADNKFAEDKEGSAQYAALRDFSNPLMWAKWQPGFEGAELWTITAPDRSYEVCAEFENTDGSAAGLYLFYDENAHFGSQTAQKHCFIRIRNERNIATIEESADGKNWQLVKSEDVSGMHHNNYHGFLALRPAVLLRRGASVKNFTYRNL